MRVVISKNPAHVATSKNHHHSKGHDDHRLGRVYRFVLASENQNDDRTTSNDEDE